MKAILKGTKQKADKAQIKMTEKDDNPVPKALPPRLKDPNKFSIYCIIGGMDIPHALCDFGSLINVIPLDKAKECDLGEIIPNNITLA